MGKKLDRRLFKDVEIEIAEKVRVGGRGAPKERIETMESTRKKTIHHSDGGLDTQRTLLDHLFQ
jgi:hypothetical protein